MFIEEGSSVKTWDVVVIGAGPGGLQCGIAAASEGLETLVLERGMPGGQIAQTPLLENCVFARGGTTGPQLALEMMGQAERMGCQFHKAEATDLYANAGPHLLTLRVKDGMPINSRTVVLAMGQGWRHLDIPGLAEGVAKRLVQFGPVETIYTDGTGDVAVYGGGPSAGQAILALAERGHKVHVILRSGLNMPWYLIERINAKRAEGRVSLYPNSSVKRVSAPADGRLGLLVATGDTTNTLPNIRRLFMCNGLQPATAWLPEDVEKDADGRVVVDANLESTMGGVFAIGDCRSGSSARVGIAIGDGSAVVSSLWKRFVKDKSCTNCERVLRA
jgi:thioredoxin reductase (NADPH)